MGQNALLLNVCRFLIKIIRATHVVVSSRYYDYLPANRKTNLIKIYVCKHRHTHTQGERKWGKHIHIFRTGTTSISKAIRWLSLGIRVGTVGQLGDTTKFLITRRSTFKNWSRARAHFENFHNYSTLNDVGKSVSVESVCGLKLKLDPDQPNRPGHGPVHGAGPGPELARRWLKCTYMRSDQN